MSRSIILVLSLYAGTAWSQPSGETPCPGTFAKGTLQDAHCHCAASTIKGPVWGTQAFTPASGICRAAVHAGVIGPEGGMVHYRAARGCPGYVGRVRHGIRSGGESARPTSFYFPKTQSGRCGGRVRGTPCPSNFTTVAHSSGTYVCSCDASMVVGQVEGDGVYSAESPICSAAVHAGAISDAGGLVKVRRGPRCGRIPPVTRNGITSKFVPKLDLSYYFPVLGEARCPGM